MNTSILKLGCAIVTIASALTLGSIAMADVGDLCPDPSNSVPASGSGSDLWGNVGRAHAAAIANVTPDGGIRPVAPTSCPAPTSSLYICVAGKPYEKYIEKNFQSFSSAGSSNVTVVTVGDLRAYLTCTAALN